MKTIRQLLETKPHQDIYSVTPHSTVFQALQVMADKDIGAVLVMSGVQLLGILSERDYARKVVLQGKASATTPVAEIMTSRVIYVRPDQSTDEAMAIMNERRFRHLPVVERDRVVGVISVTDLVRDAMSEKEFIIQQLENYIHQ
jgi:CBS domain-containing protein